MSAEIPSMSNHSSVDGRDDCESLRRPSLSVKMQRSLKRMRKSIQKITESLQEDDKHSLYIFPEQLSTLTWRTGFSKDEIRKLYRAFKQLCPRGCVTSSDLKPAYAKLFPLGDSGRYAQIVFNSFDRDGDGIVSFSDLLGTMTSIVNGNVDQKLSWIFRFYDLNGDGCITREEMLVIVSAIYDMVQNAQTIQSVINKQVDRFFEKMDADRDGIVSREEFMSGCKNDAVMYNQLFLFNNIW
ncbi:Kv channel-interacting protein 2 isoform X2 [Solenopsis invicta]|uniref:Kv channel-interacting protein 2 isoform X2 n=1 Tax=Solenopsis invicta TaxID=13686 RepID=UPI0005962760|nr:Kv channel-interacting protein 2 isoform X2 [Solenopsis invicta]